MSRPSTSSGQLCSRPSSYPPLRIRRRKFYDAKRSSRHYPDRPGVAAHGLYDLAAFKAKEIHTLEHDGLIVSLSRSLESESKFVALLNNVGRFRVEVGQGASVTSHSSFVFVSP
jgi:hypothetical protein